MNILQAIALIRTLFAGWFKITKPRRARWMRFWPLDRLGALVPFSSTFFPYTSILIGKSTRL